MLIAGGYMANGELVRRSLFSIWGWIGILILMALIAMFTVSPATPVSGEPTP